MYIGVGTLVVVLIILLIIYFVQIDSSRRIVSKRRPTRGQPEPNEKRR